MRKRERHGAALLEVLAAMTLLAVAATAEASLVAQVSASVASAQAVDRETAAASALLGRVSMWTNARLRTTRSIEAKGLHTTIEVLDQSLFKVQVVRQEDQHVLVKTTLYRPAGPDDEN